MNLLSLLDVKKPSFLNIPFEFENLVTIYILKDYSLVNENDFIEMVNWLVGPDHSYVGSALIINKEAHDLHLNDIISVVIQPH